MWDFMINYKQILRDNIRICPKSIDKKGMLISLSLVFFTHCRSLIMNQYWTQCKCDWQWVQLHKFIMILLLAGALRLSDHFNLVWYSDVSYHIKISSLSCSLDWCVFINKTQNEIANITRNEKWLDQRNRKPNGLSLVN